MCPVSATKILPRLVYIFTSPTQDFRSINCQKHKCWQVFFLLWRSGCSEAASDAVCKLLNALQQQSSLVLLSLSLLLACSATACTDTEYGNYFWLGFTCVFCGVHTAATCLIEGFFSVQVDFSMLNFSPTLSGISQT